MTPELEMMFRIYYSTRDAECVEVAEDPDGLGMIEIRHSCGAPSGRINLTDEMVPQLIEALNRLQEFRKTRS